ncbi:uncharacterized protein L969DRAFT_93688 [Mixia osmundae IAM 14324]|uniref:FIST domain-containing protein n=1 Tax=Mixia osmundae (strain CBS 9802 / IAM 14324 / JCM 22182 / KY 12970) TaxID=764103 RepID=G7E9A7_MIXOS|nr:uncharacterized protein L969DRAFT_93688 [Mixia osmundae IAM 14324]KEI39852.1 hypothetical protein L969DRAFT_93688 [Mixia osmundae IAM 14324]GAA99226.1 hypothetical protein E5Q_05919 [Mixia osmundae IAM 14324]
MLIRSALRRAPRRTYWRAATFTAGSDSSAELCDPLSSFLSGTETSKPDALIFALSQNLPSEVMLRILDMLRQAHADALGCLSDPLPASASAITSGEDRLASAAVAIHYPSDGARALRFTSKVPGRPKIALGREVKRDVETYVDDRSHWGRMSRVAVSDLRSAQNTLEQIDGLTADDLKTMTQTVYFSDDKPEGLLAALDRHCPLAAKSGLIASSTPFVTGRPFTLLKGSQIEQQGAVGVAIVDGEPGTVKLHLRDMANFGGRKRVTQSAGNIILALDDANAAALLLQHIQSFASKTDAFGNTAEYLNKDKNYYIAVFSESERPPSSHEKPIFLSRVISGDPKRGAISIDTETDILPGQWIEFMHHQGAQSAAIEPSAKPMLSFVMTATEESTPSSQRSKEGAKTIEGQFLAASEKGFVLHDSARPLSHSWICKVQDAIARAALT